MAIITAAFDSVEATKHQVGVSVHYVGTAAFLLGVVAMILRARAMHIANQLISADREAYDAAWTRVLDAQGEDIRAMQEVCMYVCVCVYIYIYIYIHI